MLSFFGIDPVVGGPSLDALSAATIARLADAVTERPRARVGSLSRDLVGDDFSRRGWGIVLPAGVAGAAPSARTRWGALAALVCHREQAARGNVVQLTYQPGESAVQFSDRSKSHLEPGQSMPQYLVLVA